ncbi:MAG: YbaY family lipoprotein [Deltaproteobacteria bacterium]|nr:YbaY family lipoprotein [Deltaproteobacteria bacterium]
MQSMQGWSVVSGTVTYRERTELPGTALCHFELLDLSQRDPRKARIGEETIWPAGIKLPVTFRISYDPSRIDPLHIYVVRARITDGEKTLFVSATMSNVLTKGASSTAEVVVVPVSIRY